MTSPDAARKASQGYRYSYQPLKPDSFKTVDGKRVNVPGDALRTVTLIAANNYDDSLECVIDNRKKSAGKDYWDGSYEALSYTWGDEEEAEDLKVLDSSTDNPRITYLKIKPNLASAFRKLRTKDEPRRLWCDAICIDQENKKERSAQVSQMATIFGRAQRVLVWLGSETEKSERAISFIKRMLVLEDFDKLINDSTTVDDWEALTHLMRSPWFTRRWVVQEIGLAKEADLICGDHSITWPEFCDAIALFERGNHKITDYFRSAKDYGYRYDYLGDITGMGAVRLVRVTHSLFRKSDSGDILARLQSLESLITTLTPFEATNPRDLIYAVLAISKDTTSITEEQAEEDDVGGKKRDATPNTRILAPSAGASTANWAKHAIGKGATHTGPSSNVNTAGLVDDLQAEGPEVANGTPTGSEREVTQEEAVKVKRLLQRYWRPQENYIVNYNKSFFEVCQYFVNFTIKRSESLDIICRPWVPVEMKQKEDLPSWLVDLSKVVHGERVDGSLDRINADTLVGPPGLDTKYYNASGGKVPISREVNERVSGWYFGGFDKRSLIVQGFVLEQIDIIEDTALGGTIPKRWLQMADAKGKVNDKPLSEPLWRTLVADRGTNGHNPPPYYRRAFENALSRQAKQAHLVTHKLLQDGNLPSVTGEYLRRVQAVTYNKKLIRTKRARPGLESDEASRGRATGLGLVPEETQRGDLICILFGCSVPVVLHKMEDPPSKCEGTQYQLVGEAYVHGMMDGEALEVQRGEKIKSQLFEIR